ncbi:PIG-L family deacetylase [Streptomyces sp. CC224B]|uniref:PIG-L family deacetylase n=1 Tax=Streptomyces sp. CC224B TaxID=3044571 RepID=UPI0024A8A3AF|nr:PIG-L family deacetylase [Streptomyces sp. CC224B]
MFSGVRRLAPTTRRDLLTAAALCAIVPVGMAAASGARDASSSAGPKHQPPALTTVSPSGTWTAAGRAPRTAESVVQIVAHPDDDLFFLNPEVGQSLRSGRPLTTIYLTSGEANGINAPRRKDAQPRLFPAERDYAKYTKARQNGIRAAYAEMVTGDATHPWRRTVIATAGGGQAELDTLQGHPHIQLVWTLLHEAGSITGDRPHSLHGLWDGRVRALGSQLAHGGAVARNFAYDREQLIRTLTGYLERFRPTQVRMQNPTPGRLDRNLKCADHQDHRYGARFVQEALARYASLGGRPHFTVQTYIGYFNGGLPGALDPASGASKARTIDTYAGDGGAPNACKDDAGCGDRKVAAHPKRNWTNTIHHAGDTGTNWLLTGKDGTLSAFAVLDGRIAQWHRPAGTGGRAAQARWSGPAFLTGTGFDAGIQPVALPDGRLAVYGTRTVLGAGPAAYQREAGYTEQRRPGSAFGPWRSLGTPEQSDLVGTSDISAPAVSVGADGATTVFLRDSAHQLTARTRLPGGTWAPWQALGGKAVHSDPVTATDSTGRAYVLAATPHTVLAWVQDRPGGPVRGPLATGLPPTTLPLTVRPDGDGVRVYFRRPHSGNLRTAHLRASDLTPVRDPRGTRAGAPARVTDLGGAGGYGPASVTPAGWGDALLAARSSTGDLATAWLPAGVDPRPQRWSRTGFLLAGAPSGTATGSGGVVLTALGLDGRLYWTQTPRKGARFAPWQPVDAAATARGDVSATPARSAT